MKPRLAFRRMEANLTAVDCLTDLVRFAERMVVKSGVRDAVFLRPTHVQFDGPSDRDPSLTKITIRMPFTSAMLDREDA